jgi:hypothetical protein
MKSKNYVPPGSDVGGGAFAKTVFSPHKKGRKDHGVKPGVSSNGSSHNGSQTSGKSKGIRPTSIQRFMCTRNRSHKHPLYDVVMAGIGKRGTKASAG